MKYTIADLIRREGREPGGAYRFDPERAIRLIRQLPPPESVTLFGKINPVALEKVRKAIAKDDVWISTAECPECHMNLGRHMLDCERGMKRI